jgi:hypothetical protein
MCQEATYAPQQTHYSITSSARASSVGVRAFGDRSAENSGSSLLSGTKHELGARI